MIPMMLRLVPVLALLSSCSREASTAPPTATAPAAPGGPSASETLDQLDERAPVPLLPMMANHQKAEMRDHLAAVQEIVAALATEDYPGIEQAAARIGSSEQTGQMCTHMGAAASDFTEQALAFHRTADGIAAAARDRDRTRVLAELGTTMRACTSCHATWKQQVVDEATWDRLTSSAPPSHGAHGAAQ
jgi:cytochrome c556